MKQTQLLRDEEIPLGDLCEIVIGKTPSRKNLDNFGEDYIWVSIGDMNAKYIEDSKEKLTAKGVKESNARLVPVGTLLLSFKLSLGKVAITRKPLYTNEAIAALIPKRRINVEYLYYCLKQINLSTYARKAVKGLCLNKRILSRIKIKLVPTKTQDKIVSILKNAEKLKQWRKEADELTDDYLHSVFLELFGSPVKNDRHWETITLKEISEFYSGKAWKNEELSDQGVRIVRISNLHKKNFPFWHYPGEIIEKYSVSDGDLLFSWAGVEKSIDAYIYGGEKALLNQHIYNIKIVNSEFPKLFVYWVLRLFLRYLRSQLGGGVGQFHLKKSTIENIRIINPPLELTRKFVLIVEATDEIRKKQIESKKQIGALHNVLMQKAFGGELVC
ncbi:MAG: restriction endonuclease subunit S [Candidatus Bathyarchaeota archaeon]|nr:restriction endonuclease subunit S [Candidatus Bathyarchaeota archaeon]